jgi:hypothetical protein
LRRVIVFFFFGEFLYGSLKVSVDGAEKSVAFGQAPLVLFVGDSTARLLYVAFVHVHMH